MDNVVGLLLGAVPNLRKLVDPVILHIIVHLVLFKDKSVEAEDESPKDCRDERKSNSSVSSSSPQAQLSHLHQRLLRL